MIALFGSSCTGKTAVAKELSRQLGIERRSCGEIVRQMATDAGVSMGALSGDDHRAIDAETRARVEASKQLVVEGRFLNYVLANAAQACPIVRLEASESTRLARMADRGTTSPPPDAIETEDRRDREFIDLMYRAVQPLAPRISIQTDGLTVAQVVDSIRKAGLMV